jgi:hypothetical protein
MVNSTTVAPVDCACVIHGNAYSWAYVEKLHSMLSRHITPGIRLHVYTEPSRTVPDLFIKHELTDWKITGPKKSWWYKMQMFNPEHHAGPLLYFDLDVVITGKLNWIYQTPPVDFWAVRDFKHLWRPTFYGINSSIMYWNTIKYAHIWEKFKQQDLTHIMKKYHGDQDYITEAVPLKERKFFDTNRVQSWRWQCLDGGYDFRKRKHYAPGSGTQLLPTTSIMVFHGQPKPEQTTDLIIQQHWQ